MLLVSAMLPLGALCCCDSLVIIVLEIRKQVLIPMQTLFITFLCIKHENYLQGSWRRDEQRSFSGNLTIKFDIEILDHVLIL